MQTREGGLNFAEAETGIFRDNRSISCMLMPWLLASPSHQQPWYWLYRINCLYIPKISMLARCGLVTIFGAICLLQHWFSPGRVTWWHQIHWRRKKYICFFSSSTVAINKTSSWYAVVPTCSLEVWYSVTSTFDCCTERPAVWSGHSLLG